MAVKASNTITLMRVDDGTGYTVLLSNEAHSFEGGTSAALAGSTATNVIAYKNTSQIPVTVSNIGGTAVSGNPTGLATGVTGLTASVTGNGTSSCRITFQATTSLTTVNGSITITLVVDGRSFVKNFSFSITLKGPAGPSGRTYFIEPSSNVLKRSADHSISPNFVEFKSYYRDGNSATRYAYSGRFIIEETTDGNTWTTIYTSTANENTVKHYLYSMLADATGTAVATANGDTIGIPRDVVAVRCKLYAAGGTTNLMDMQSVAVVTDVDALTHEEIFDLLTNNGQVKGIYKEGNQLYISFTYAKGGALTLGGIDNTYGTLQVLNNTGQEVASLSRSGFVIGGDESFPLFTVKSNDRILKLTPQSAKISAPNSAWGGISIVCSYGTNNPVEIILEDGNGYSSIGTDRRTFEGHTILDTLTSVKNISCNGNLTVKGTKSRVAKTLSYGEVLQAAYETSFPMFGDLGEAQTDADGCCYITIDVIFQETVNTAMPYYVFLQKEGEGDLWVEEKCFNYFKVIGTPNLKFSWEIKVRQKEYEYGRLESYNEKEDYKDVDYELQSAMIVKKYCRDLEDMFNEEIN